MRIRSLAGTLLATGGIILATLLPAAGAAAESESEPLAQVTTEQQDQLVAVEQDDPEQTGPAETAPAEASPADAADVASDSDELGDPGEPDMPQSQLGESSAEGLPNPEDEAESDEVSREAAELPVMAAQAVPFADGDMDCSYADPGSGTYAQSLCWFNFDGFTTQYVNTGSTIFPNWQSVLGNQYTVSGSQYPSTGTTRYGYIQNYPITIRLDGGYVLTAQLSTEGGNNARALVAQSFPTYSAAFLGNTLNGEPFYTGVSGKPAINNALDGAGNTAKITLNNINLTRTVGGVTTDVRNFSIVVADAESTDTNESITWTTTGQGFLWLPNKPPPTSKTAVMGNACPQTATPVYNSTTPSTPAVCASNVSSNKTGTAMLQTLPPTNPSANFQVVQQMKAGGKQAVAFGVLVARAEVNVQVADRVALPAGESNNFVASVRNAATNELLVDAATGTVENTAQASAGLQILPAGIQLDFSSEVTGPAHDSYEPQWVCSKTTTTSATATRWPTSGYSATPPSSSDSFTKILPGEYVGCTVKYVPPYLTLAKSVDQAGTAAANKPEDFTLKADGSISQISGNGSIKSAVAADSYNLTETAPVPGGANWAYGYDWEEISCLNKGATVPTTNTTDADTGALTGAKLDVGKSADVVCTYTNRANEPQLVLEKSSDPASGTTVGQLESLSYQLKFDNSTGTAPMGVDHIDHLRDVLDDATWVGNIQYSSVANPGTADWAEVGSGIQATFDQTGQQLNIVGTVPRNSVRHVRFEVKTKENADGFPARENPSAPLEGYSLRNYLTKAGEAAPTSCAASSGLCTEHPVLAWKTTKMAQPLDGAALHVGGDLHYQIRVERINKKAAGDIEGIVVSDDLTQAYRYSRWYPAAPVPGPALQRGIYFYQASGSPFTVGQIESGAGAGTDTNRLPMLQPAGAGGAASWTDIEAANAYVPPPVFTPNPDGLEAQGGTCPGPGVVPGGGPENPDCLMGTWKLETPAFTLPDGAAYADVWFSSRIGFPLGKYDGSSSDDPNKLVWNNEAALVGEGGSSEPTGDWKDYWQPYRQVATGQPFYNVGSSEASGATVGESQLDIGGSLTCSTQAMSSSQDPPYNPAGLVLYPQNGDEGPFLPIYPTVKYLDRLPDPVPPENPVPEGSAPPEITQSCVVSQRVDANYFVIRKDLLFRDDQGELDRAINMVGHDLDVAFKVGGTYTPVQNVCKYSNGDGTNSYALGDGELSCSNLGADWTPLMCEDWNDPDDPRDPAETCARFREIPSGAQAGRFRADRLPAGEYQLTETRAPRGSRVGPGQWDTDVNVLPMPGAQLLTQPIYFEVWGEGSGKEGQLDVVGVEERCAIPFGGEVSDLPTACINPTGYVMVITDVAGPRLPFTGGPAAVVALATAGGVALAAATAGAFWWRRKRESTGQEVDAK